MRSAPDESPRAWLGARAIALEAFDPGTARVVALGDATHGTHETYVVKQRLAPPLVAAGFRLFAFEAPYAEMKRLDEYVVHGTGDPAALLDAMRWYWFWNSHEILELVRWMRAQNEAGLTPPIRIAGIDPTTPAHTTAEVAAFLRRVDPDAASAAEAAYACMLAPRYRGGCRSEVDAVRPAMEAKRDEYARLASVEEVDEILHAARRAEQEERVLVGGMNVRDPFLAENVLHHVRRGAKVVTLGHNEHWGRTPYLLHATPLIESAGGFLAAELGDDYLAIGTLILGGTFHAVEYGYGGGVIRAQTMNAPSADDFALRFAQAGVDFRFVSLRGRLPAWLAGTHRLRFAGSAVRSRTDTTLDVPADLGAKWDGVVYLETSTPSRLRAFPVY